jgi:hypothetical protein
MMASHLSFERQKLAGFWSMLRFLVAQARYGGLRGGRGQSPATTHLTERR